MDYAEYSALCAEAARLDEAGKTVEALAIFDALVESDISPIDRSLMLNNVAVLLEKLGRVEEALAAYDKAIALERPLCRSTLAEYKAAYLHRLGRNGEALALYRRMAAEPWATEAEKHRFTYNIGALSGQPG